MRTDVRLQKLEAHAQRHRAPEPISIEIIAYGTSASVLMTPGLQSQLLVNGQPASEEEWTRAMAGEAA